MKFFSLLNKDAIHNAPGKKIIPESEYSQLLEAKEIVEKAKQDEIIYRENVVKECETLKEEAEKKGFRKDSKDSIKTLRF